MTLTIWCEPLYGEEEVKREGAELSGTETHHPYADVNGTAEQPSQPDLVELHDARHDVTPYRYEGDDVVKTSAKWQAEVGKDWRCVKVECDWASTGVKIRPAR